MDFKVSFLNVVTVLGEASEDSAENLVLQILNTNTKTLTLVGRGVKRLNLQKVNLDLESIQSNNFPNKYKPLF